MNAQLAIANNNLPPVQTQVLWSPEEEKHIREYYAKDANEHEWKHFMFMASERKLDPRLNQFYFIKYGNKASFVTGIDGYRLIAHRTGRLEAIETSIRKDGDDLYGVAIVYVKGSNRAYKAEAPFSEFNAKTPTWQKMPQTMIKKCAEALALRMAFPQDLSGLYTQEEMDQAENSNSHKEEQSKDTEKRKAQESLIAMMDTIKQLKKEHNVTEEQFKWATGLDTLRGKSTKQIEQAILDLNAWVNRDTTDEEESAQDFIEGIITDQQTLETPIT